MIIGPQVIVTPPTCGEQFIVLPPNYPIMPEKPNAPPSGK
jgi:hypothetical protein